jgi:hypothetical protein
MSVLRAKAEARRQPCLGLLLVHQNWGGSIAEKEKRPRGRPRTGRDPPVTVRLPKELETAIAAWIDLQPDPKPSRSEAIRRLIERGLGLEK